MTGQVTSVVGTVPFMNQMAAAGVSAGAPVQATVEYDAQNLGTSGGAGVQLFDDDVVTTYLIAGELLKGDVSLEDLQAAVEKAGKG